MQNFEQYQGKDTLQTPSFLLRILGIESHISQQTITMSNTTQTK